MSKFTSKNLGVLLRQQDFKCALTGRQLEPEQTALDHIVPITKGGENSIDNVQFVTAAANVAKGTLDLDEFIELCRDVVRTHGMGDEEVVCESIYVAERQGTSDGPPCP